MPDRDFERELRELGTLIDYPPTPDVARAARHVLEEDETSRPRAFRMTFPAVRWAAVAAALVLVVAVPTFSPGLRATVSEWFVAGGVYNAGEPAVDAGSPERQTEAGAPSAGVSKNGEPLALRFSGERISLREARARMDGTLLLPRTLGKPEELYAPGTSAKGGVVLVYSNGLPPLGDTGISLVLTQVPGDLGSTFLREKANIGSELERVRVNGDPGYLNAAGRSPSAMNPPLPGNILLWEKSGVALRLEVNLPKKRAIRIAESVR
jgi:hypothetical protein